MDIHKKIKFATNNENQTLTLSKRSIQTNFTSMCTIYVDLPCKVDVTGNTSFLIFQVGNTVYNYNSEIPFDGGNLYYVIVADIAPVEDLQLCRIGGAGPDLGKITDILTNDCTPI